MSKKFLISLSDGQYKTLQNTMQYHTDWLRSISGINPKMSETEFARQMVILGLDTLSRQLKMVEHDED